MIDTLPLLRLLSNANHETLTRGEIRRKLIGLDTDSMINEAEMNGQIIIQPVNSIHAQNGDGWQSNLASVLLTDVGEDAVNEAEAVV